MKKKANLAIPPPPTTIETAEAAVEAVDDLAQAASATLEAIERSPRVAAYAGAALFGGAVAYSRNGSPDDALIGMACAVGLTMLGEVAIQAISGRPRGWAG